MTDNRKTLEWLFEKQKIDIKRGRIFDTSPPPMPGVSDFDRVEGMMLGLAIGDALGNTSEGLHPRKRRAMHGEIRDYRYNPRANAHVGLPSDDTQLAFWTLEQMIEDGAFNPEHVARRFCGGRIFGIGATVSEFVRNYSGGKSWYECGTKSAGNGALMRIAPMVIPHLKSVSSDLWVDTVLSAMITHNDSASIASCVAFVNMLWELLGMEAAPQPNWWLEAFVNMARHLESDNSYRSRSSAFKSYRGTLCQFLQENVSEAYGRDISAVEACDSWFSGAYLLETVPSVIYILMKHGSDPEEAIVRAANDTVDNDTIGAIVGAAVGALYGRRRLPERWVSKLPGRTAEADDGRIFEMLSAAKALWG
ncbi:ADP-ribosylglycohydrolase family protein [Candidatus Poribacteria bacterium]|nr:ADP-ribosylglycohydrolase family protein [Candidatus Poribacteria bacterium]